MIGPLAIPMGDISMNYDNVDPPLANAGKVLATTSKHIVRNGIFM